MKTKIKFDEITIKASVSRKRGMEEIDALDLVMEILNKSNMAREINKNGYTVCAGEIEDFDEKYFYASITYSQNEIK